MLFDCCVQLLRLSGDLSSTVYVYICSDSLRPYNISSCSACVGLEIKCYHSKLTPYGNVTDLTDVDDVLRLA